MGSFLSLLSLTVLTIMLLASPVRATSLEQFCATRGILPGEGIGSINLGDSFVETVHRLGKPSGMAVTHADDPFASPTRWRPITRPEDGIQGHVWADFGPQDHYLEIRAADNVIDDVLVFGFSDCQDPHGLHAGSPGSTIIDQYGQSYSMRRAPQAVSVVYNSMGVHFALKPTDSGLGPISAISVFLPTQYCKAMGRTLCDHYEPRLQ